MENYIVEDVVYLGNMQKEVEIKIMLTAQFASRRYLIKEVSLWILMNFR